MAKPTLVYLRDMPPSVISKMKLAAKRSRMKVSGVWLLAAERYLADVVREQKKASS
jgi:hypothetical protein